MQNITAQYGGDPLGTPLKLADASGNTDPSQTTVIPAASKTESVNMQGARLALLVELQAGVVADEVLNIEYSATKDFAVVTVPAADGSISVPAGNNGANQVLIYTTNTPKLGYVRVNNTLTESIKVWYAIVLP